MWKEGGLTSSGLAGRLLSGGLWVLLSKIVAIAAGLAANMLLARLMTSKNLGAYFLVTSVVGVAGMLAKLGMGMGGVRLLSEAVAREEWGNVRAWVRLIFITAGFSSVVVCAAMVALWNPLADGVFGSPLMKSARLAAASWLLAATFLGLCSQSFRGLHDIRLASVFEGLLRAPMNAAGLLICWVVLARFELVDAVLMMAGVLILQLALAGALLGRRIYRLPTKGEAKVSRLFDTSLPIFLIGLGTMILSQADLWIVGAHCTEHDVALYGAAVRIVTLVAVPLTLANLVLPPYISSLYTAGEIDRLQSVLRLAASIAAAPALAVLTVMIFWAGDVLQLVYGDVYSQAALILVLLSLGQAVNVTAGSCGNVLSMTGHQRMGMKIALMAGVVTVGGELLLVRWAGVAGVAIASAGGRILQNILLVAAARRRVGVWSHATANPWYLRRAVSLVREQQPSDERSNT